MKYFWIAYNLSIYISLVQSYNVSISDNVYLNYGIRKQFNPFRHKTETTFLKHKLEVLGKIFRDNLKHIKDSNKKVDLIFLLDGSSSVGEKNFQNEIKFVQKLLSDFLVSFETTRIAVVTFSSKDNIMINIDHISNPTEINDKCFLLNKQLKNLKYTGGATFTLGAFLVAQTIYKNYRRDSRKVIFLMTDGFSNGGDPVPVAKDLRQKGVVIFTIGIRNGNAKELFQLASQPGQYYSFLLDSFSEFESLARRALHTDQQIGEYITVNDQTLCKDLCSSHNSCCDKHSTCSCDILSGQYKCLCDFGYSGSGLEGSCLSCPNGTFALERNICVRCPDDFHITSRKLARSPYDCKCKMGYKPRLGDEKCVIIQCPIIQAPENGYFVKQTDCSNIVNNACKVRCKVGYTLDGPKTRICQTNGNWSGSEQSCKVKACSILKAPENGQITCIDEDNRIIDLSKLNNDFLPIDTICRIQCAEGFFSVGPKVRNCLPNLNWSGIETICKPVKCSRLPKIQFGNYFPLSCHKKKSNFGTNCTVICKNGFKLKGPSFKICTGKYGHWSSRIPNVCQDVTPPNIKCPKDVNGFTLPGKNYGFVQWNTETDITDNSDLNIIFWTKPVINDINTFKFKIGKTTITYIAMDAFKNKAKCNFTVEIKDIEPPVIENCEDPVPFLVDKDGIDITWDEPKVYDNSQQIVMVEKNYTGVFSFGVTPVKYIATDLANNTNECILNITVDKSTCEPIPDPVYGKSICDNVPEGIQCVITCEEGYAYNIIDDDDINIKSSFSNDSAVMLCNNTDPIWYLNEIPECSVTEIPNEILQHGSLNFDANEDCKNIDVINMIKNEILNNVENSLDTICVNEIECYPTEFILNCSTNSDNSNELPTNLTTLRRKRDSQNMNKRRSRIQIQFIINGKIKSKSTSKVKHITFNKFNKIQERLSDIQIFMKNNETLSNLLINQTKYFIDLKLDRVFAICNNGSISRKNKCVKCPKGTFHNVTRGLCQSCPIGNFNDKTGQNKCKHCPPLTSTRRIRSKMLSDCQGQCPPGTSARKRKLLNNKKIKNPANINHISLYPFCNKCDIGFYQPEYGKTYCTQCPQNMTTEEYGSKTISNCFRNITNFCQNESICNTGTCILDGSHYFCKCPENYFGSHCEIQFNSCTSNPCSNNGKCLANFELGNFTCECMEGYHGVNCEMEHCVNKFCRNGGTCIRQDSEEFCICDKNFYGEFCEHIENYCLYNFCENNSTCVETNNDYKCICKNGFLGKRCHYLPCDYLPCPENATCVNQDYGNVTSRNSYKCDCPLGFEGHNCSIKIDYCAKLPCLNHGICINMENDFKCGCIVPFTGKICETKLDSNFMLTFPQSGITDFVKIPGRQFSLSEISTCLWIQTIDTFNYGTMISYATKEYDNAFTITDYNGVVLYINNEFKVTDIFVNDGRWHFLCVTWSSFRGEYSIYVDGDLKESGNNFGTNKQIDGNGTFVIGQEQDAEGEKFSQAESFTGNIANLDVWYGILSENEILKFYKTCYPYYGNLLFWGEIKSYLNGNIRIEPWPFCGSCSIPKSVKNGWINVDNNVAYYTCRRGFRLYYKGTYYDQMSRSCTKTAEWEGIIEPTCQIVECNYPNVVENGFFIGSHFEYGSTLMYHCNKGYMLIGELVLHCLENGNWSSTPPYCLGPQCPSLEQPGNSLMTVFLNKRSHIIKSTFDVGTKVEFRCLDGTYLKGDSLITCLENETWSSNVPICKEIIVNYTESAQEKNHDFRFLTTKLNITEEATISSTISELKFDLSDQQMNDFRSPSDTDIMTDKIVVSSNSTESSFTSTDNQMNHFSPSKNTDIVKKPVFIASQLVKSTIPKNSQQMKDLRPSTNIDTVMTKFLLSSKLTESTFTTTDNQFDDLSVITEKPLISIMSSESIFYTTDKKENDFKLLMNEDITTTEALTKIDPQIDDSRPLATMDTIKNVARISTITSTDNATNINNRHSENFYVTKFTPTETTVEDFPTTITTEINDLTDKYFIDNATIVDEDYSTIMMHTILEPVFCESTNLPQNPLNANYLSDNLLSTYEVGTKLEFKCQPGFQYASVNFTECLADGLWSINDFFCKPMLCKLPPRPKVMSLLNGKNSYIVGDTVKYECNDGFKGYGKNSIRCLTTGSWTRILLRCAKISCGKPKFAKETRIIGNSYLYMDTVKIECLEYSTKKVFELQCYPNGKWMPNVEC